MEAEADMTGLIVGHLEEVSEPPNTLRLMSIDRSSQNALQRHELTLEQGQSQTTPRPWYNGCDTANHDTREEGEWRWRGQAQAT